MGLILDVLTSVVSTIALGLTSQNVQGFRFNLFDADMAEFVAISDIPAYLSLVSVVLTSHFTGSRDVTAPSRSIHVLSRDITRVSRDVKLMSHFIDVTSVLPGMLYLGLKWVRLSQNRTKRGLFRISFHYISAN